MKGSDGYAVKLTGLLSEESGDGSRAMGMQNGWFLADSSAISGHNINGSGTSNASKQQNRERCILPCEVEAVPVDGGTKESGCEGKL